MTHGRTDCYGRSAREITLKCRTDTAIQKEYVAHGGVLHYVLRDLATAG